MFCQALTSRDVPFGSSTELNDMPGALVVPRLVFIEHVNLQWLCDSKVRQSSCWNSWEGSLGKAGAYVGGLLEAEGSRVPLLLAALGPSRLPRTILIHGHLGGFGFSQFQCGLVCPINVTSTGVCVPVG